MAADLAALKSQFHRILNGAPEFFKLDFARLMVGHPGAVPTTPVGLRLGMQYLADWCDGIDDSRAAVLAHLVTVLISKVVDARTSMQDWIRVYPEASRVAAETAMLLLVDVPSLLRTTRWDVKLSCSQVTDDDGDDHEQLILQLWMRGDASGVMPPLVVSCFVGPDMWRTHSCRVRFNEHREEEGREMLALLPGEGHIKMMQPVEEVGVIVVDEMVELIHAVRTAVGRYDADVDATD